MRLRFVLRGVLILVLLATLAAAGLTLHAGTRYRAARARFAQQFGAPDPTALAVEEMPVESNAATWLTRGTRALSDDEDSRRELVRLAVVPSGAWTEEDSAAASRALDGQRRGLELLHRAATCASGNFGVDYSLGMNARLPEYVSLLDGSRVLLVDARLALARRDVETAVLDLETLASSIRTLDTDSLLASTLVAFAMDRQYLALARDLLASWPDEPGLLAALDRHLSHRDLQRSVRRGLRGEGTWIDTAVTQAMAERGATPIGRLERVLDRPFEQLFMADLMDDYGEFGEVLDKSWPELGPLIAHRRQNPRFWNRHVSLVGNIEDLAARLKALESSYGLGRAALLFATTRQKPELGRDPFTGDRMTATPLTDGGYAFGSPGAAELWQETQHTPANTSLLPFDWPVPAG